jgi:purine-nucleoside phosphorylase
MQQPYPILEFDSDRRAMIEADRHIKPIDMPEHCVVCFFHDVIREQVERGRLRPIAIQRSEIGDHPIYLAELDDGRSVTVFHPGVGAPLAAGLLEEVIALGGRKFIACGGAGALDQRLTLGHLIVPDAAVRDEGTSYHYLPPGREVEASPAGVAAIERVLDQHGLPYVTGKVWTTDAIFRETAGKVRMRRDEGCLAVEMEAAAFFAVAQFRGVIFAQLLYSGDDLSGPEWDGRGWTSRADVRDHMFWLAVEAVLQL